MMEGDFSGLTGSFDKHDHGELDAMLRSMMEALQKRRGQGLSDRWMGAGEAVLDTYLGEVPTMVKFEGTEHKPFAMTSLLGINPDDYIEITSYSHHPWYGRFELEIPDNWSGAHYYKVPLEELMFIIDHALKNGYSLVWDGDVSHEGFRFKEGTASVPVKETAMAPTEYKVNIQVDSPGACKAEEYVDQDVRQAAFDRLTTNDDHLMHITSLVEGPSGKYYYKTKNSWSAEKNAYGGYVYMTEAYLRLNTVAIMLHKKALPPDIYRQLGLK
jgi:bleomycin hydrolase